jgi:hypothetical protein
MLQFQADPVLHQTVEHSFSVDVILRSLNSSECRLDGIRTVGQNRRAQLRQSREHARPRLGAVEQLVCWFGYGKA